MPPHTINKTRAKALNVVCKSVMSYSKVSPEMKSVKVNDRAGQIDGYMQEG